MKRKFTTVKEAKRRSREAFGQVPKTRSIPDKRRKKDRHKKDLTKSETHETI